MSQQRALELLNQARAALAEAADELKDSLGVVGSSDIEDVLEDLDAHVEDLKSDIEDEVIEDDE